MNPFVRQTERADGRLDGLASPSFYDTMEKHRGECYAFVRFVSLLSRHGGMVVGNTVLRFRLAVSKFSVIQPSFSTVKCETGTEVNEDARTFDYALRFIASRNKKKYSATAP